MKTKPTILPSLSSSSCLLLIFVISSSFCMLQASSQTAIANTVEPSLSPTDLMLNESDPMFFNSTDSSDYSIDLIYNYESLVKMFKLVGNVRQIYLTLGSLITSVGFLMNIMCIFIFYKSRLFKNSSFPYYVYVISLVDSLNILVRFVVPQFMENYFRRRLVSDYNMTETEINWEKYQEHTEEIASPYLCSTFVYVYNSLTLLSVWLMAAVSVERWLVVKFTIQSKRRLRLRALIMLSAIFLIIFSLNVFDMAPGFYIKPQWYANLTLSCERSDIRNDLDSSVWSITNVYRRLGPFSFNTDTFVLVRTLLQSIVPFLVVLIFNSLIIYNFKKIKKAARGSSLGGRRSNASSKAQSLVSVNSGTSFYNAGSLKQARKAHKSRSKHRSRRSNNQSFNNNQLDLPSNRSCSKSITNSTSRSPSPFNISTATSAPNTPINSPFNLVSALNLAPYANNKHSSVNGQEQPTSDALNKNGESKMFKVQHHKTIGSFLAPPSRRRFHTPTTPTTDTSSQNTGGDSGGSSANLSLAATSNLTTSTTLLKHNPTSCSSSNNSNKNEGSENWDQGKSEQKNQGDNPVGHNNQKSDDDNLSFIITSANKTPAECCKKISATTQTTPPSRINGSGAVSFDRYSKKSKMSLHRSTNHSYTSSKMKLSRETDIMLIVLSFSILISQLPCTIIWYLIYYKGLLLVKQPESTHRNGLLPILLYCIRLLEMVYFSLNFLFYITLSASLRREIKNYLSNVINNFFSANKSLLTSSTAARANNNNRDSMMNVSLNNYRQTNVEITPIKKKRKRSGSKNETALRRQGDNSLEECSDVEMNIKQTAMSRSPAARSKYSFSDKQPTSHLKQPESPDSLSSHKAHFFSKLVRHLSLMKSAKSRSSTKSDTSLSTRTSKNRATAVPIKIVIDDMYENDQNDEYMDDEEVVVVELETNGAPGLNNSTTSKNKHKPSLFSGLLGGKSYSEQTQCHNTVYL